MRKALIEKQSSSESELTRSYFDLLEKCLQGNQRAEKKLFDLFAPDLFAVCIRYMKTQERAQDTLQEGFVKIYTKLSDYNGKGSLEGWMKRVMANTCLDQLRRDQKLKLNIPIDNISKDDCAIKDVYSPEEKLIVNDILRVANSLPDRYRIVFSMTINGYSHKEIADKLNIAEGTSKSQLFKAKKLLRKKLIDLEID